MRKRKRRPARDGWVKDLEKLGERPALASIGNVALDQDQCDAFKGEVMAIFRVRVALAAGAVNNNVMAGSKFEFLGRPAVVSLWGTDDGTGSAILDFTLGNVVVAEDIPLNNAAVAGDIRKDSDYVGAGAGDGGDRIQIRVRNTDAVNAVNANIMLEIAEVA